MRRQRKAVYTHAMNSSGTGWREPCDDPGARWTLLDNKIFYSRIEYHCAKCGAARPRVRRRRSRRSALVQ
jgi:hypothetical protein